MTIIDIWFGPNEFQNIAFENTNAFGFSDLHSRLFHSFIAEGKKDFFKKLCFIQSWGIFSEFREKYVMFGEATS